MKVAVNLYQNSFNTKGAKSERMKMALLYNYNKNMQARIVFQTAGTELELYCSTPPSPLSH